MDFDRPSVSRSGERPVTRWKRDKESPAVFTDYPSSDVTSSRPTSQHHQHHHNQKPERPISRRGLKSTDITDFGISRPPTSSGGARTRPPSPGSIRPPTAAPRIGTPLGSARIGSAISRNFAGLHQPNAVIHDRPITQQGLVGVRSGSARSGPKLAKQIQDKMYYKQLLQMKIQELNQEITSIASQVGDRNMEIGKYQYYNGMTDDYPSNEDLRDYDFNDDDYDDDREMIREKNNRHDDPKQEAKALKDINDSIDDITQKYEQATVKFKELSKEIEFKQKIAEKFGNSMDEDTKAKYEEAFNVKNELQRDIDRIQEDRDKMIKMQTVIKERIALSPLKQEICDWYDKLMESDPKRRKSAKEKNDTHNQDETSEKIDDVDTAERQIMEIEKKIADARHELEQLEAETEDVNDDSSGSGETTTRPKTAKIRTEQLLAKTNGLEEQIVERLERIADNINENTDKSRLSDDDMGTFVELMEHRNNDVNKNDKSYDELKRDYLKLCQSLGKLEILESKIFTDNGTKNQADVMVIDERTTTTINPRIINNDDNIRDNNDSIAESNDKRSTNKQTRDKRNYDELAEKIKINEIHRFVSVLEDKLTNYSSDSARRSSTDDNKVATADSSVLTKATIDLAARYNNVLINNMKLVY